MKRKVRKLEWDRDSGYIIVYNREAGWREGASSMMWNLERRDTLGGIYWQRVGSEYGSHRERGRPEKGHCVR